MQFPGDPLGTDVLSNWLRRLVATCRAARLLPGNGYRLKETPGGTYLEFDPSGGGGVAGAITCSEYDGTPGHYSNKQNQVVTVSGSTNTGSYICMVAVPTTDPWAGAPDWAMLPSGGLGPWV